MSQWKSYSTEEQIQRTGMVIEQFSETERLVNSIIFDFVMPHTDAEDFVRLNLLDNSIVSFSSKVKLLQVIDRAKGASLVNRDQFHRLLSIRNAFAHNSVGESIEVEFPANAKPDTYFFIESMKGNGALQRTRRDDAYGEFQRLVATANAQLTLLLETVRKY